MKSKFYRIFSLTLAMLLTVSLMACAGTPGQVPSAEPSPDEASGESAGEPSGETAGEVTGESDEASVPTREGPIELKIGISEDMDSLSPYTAILGGAFAVTKYAFYEYLCGVKEDGSLDPQIAKSWTTEDGYVYNVEIYDYITDSAGNHITAADIEWSMNLHKNSGTNANLNKMEYIKATGDYSLEIKMKSNTIGTFSSITRASPIVSRKAYEESPDEMASMVVATGPYTIESFEPGAYIRLVKREDYWQTPELTAYYSRSNPDIIEFRFIGEPSQMGIALETGAIDVAARMDQTIGEKYLNDSNYDSFIVDSAQGIQLYFSGGSNRIVYNNPKLRQAVNVAIDINGIIKAAYNGYGIPQYTVGPEQAGNYLAKWKDEPYFPYDPEYAKELLKEAGYAPGEVTLVLQCLNNSVDLKVAQVIQGYLLAVGINTEIVNLDSSVHVNNMKEGSEYDMALDKVRSDYINGLWNTKFNMELNSGKTFYAVVDEEQQELLEKCIYEDSTPESIDAFHQFLKEKAYARGLCAPQNFNFARAGAGIAALHYDPRSAIVAGATEFR